MFTTNIQAKLAVGLLIVGIQAGNPKAAVAVANPNERCAIAPVIQRRAELESGQRVSELWPGIKLLVEPQFPELRSVAPSLLLMMPAFRRRTFCPTPASGRWSDRAHVGFLLSLNVATIDRIGPKEPYPS